MASTMLGATGCASETTGGELPTPIVKAEGMASCAITGDSAHVGGRATWSAQIEGSLWPAGLAFGADGALWVGADAYEDVAFTCADPSTGKDSLWVGAIDPSGALRFQTRYGDGEGVFGTFGLDARSGVGVMSRSSEYDAIHPDRDTSSLSRIGADGHRVEQTFASGRWEAWEISVAKDGTVYILGRFQGPLHFGADTLVPSAHETPWFLGAVSARGEARWARAVVTPKYEDLPSFYHLAALPSGGVALVGFGGPNTPAWEGHSLEGLFVASFDEAGAITSTLTRPWNNGSNARVAAGANGELAFSYGGQVELVDERGESVWNHEIAGHGSGAAADMNMPGLTIDAARRVTLIAGAEPGLAIDGEPLANPGAGEAALVSFDASGAVLRADVIPAQADITNFAKVLAAPDGSLAVSATIAERPSMYIARFPAP